MAKRSKKKNPNILTKRQKEDVLFNQNLDAQKKVWDIRLNVTMGIVIAVFLLAFLILPALNMNFTTMLSELSSEVSSDEDMEFAVTIDMSLLSFLTAGAGGYKDAVEYLADHTGTGMDKSITYPIFMKKMTAQDVEMLNSAYVTLLILAIVMIVCWILLFSAVCSNRKKNGDGKFLFLSVAVFAALCIAQWLIFLAVGIASVSKGQIQPHIASYLILGCGISVAAVYGTYRAKVKKLNRQRREVPTETDLDREKG
ncbi:MAG: hypothetical protein K2G37_04690 [Clostridia bacterium]|nr:hypothetical protein [Clostridia bacterium]MDE7328892.1 hypothetical protein [Clostridia bacterium]